MSANSADYNYTVITTCKGRLHHLKITLPYLTSDPKAEVIVVDYDCPQKTHEWVKQTFGTRVKVVHFENRPKFNISIARNAGAKIATQDILIFVDADVIPIRQAIDEMAKKVNRKTYVTITTATKNTTPANKQTTGTVAMHRSSYLQVNGYDDVFDSWGGEDSDIYNKLNEIGISNATVEGKNFSTINHDDSDRLKFHTEKKLSEIAKKTRILVKILATARQEKINLKKYQKIEIYSRLKYNKNIFNNIQIKLNDGSVKISCRRRYIMIGPMHVKVTEC
ncbi:glycosyltransferase family 2 protein [Roseobacter sp. HKCCD5988]|uniref:glycosyltransferase family 2 protein n=1 Tax=Roseobacter sp. HKCCD5988 TaxID=3120338 RepID=UPI0030EC58E3